MANTVSKIKVRKVKNGLLQGKTAKQAMLDAGYKETTAGHNISPYNKLLQTVHAEIEREFKLSDVTVEQVIKEIDTIRLLAEKQGDLSTAGRMSELKGRWLAMFTDRKVIDAKVITNEDQAIIDTYMPGAKSSNNNRLGSLTGEL